eukprot:TRINITY_DN15_c0_g1_i1.p2 TRINITY_DN15_c0_g1~~TRINITY_DN15_c0_g1_i1.p2  ORF type:complete len:105 (+),score=19.48 TRINITY_DN15_c0_g1_i1:113-427(+)
MAATSVAPIVFTVCEEGEACVSNYLVGFTITAGFTGLFTFFFIAMHFIAWSKYRRNKRLAMERAGAASKGEETSSRRARGKKAIDPSVFYSNYGAPLQAYGESQ